MATTHAAAGAQPAQQPTDTADLRRQNFDLAISLTLHTWPALTLAVQNEWGGPDSADKRDWFAGAVSDLFAARADALDVLDVEELLLQVMLDEFGVALEDESEVEVAERLWRLWGECREGAFSGVERLLGEWKARGGKGVRFVDGGEVVEEGEEGEDDEDEEMEEAPALVPAKEKPAPEVDEDGFTKVVGKKRR